ncbi:hypothetical protein AB0C28_00625 [Nonomuraea sp. NPDC048892]|uniref:hypothetical protein n=1 Tax=Nonomuraea sp. NPDC048892 TaxID=3154624 RepID=UPI0033F5AE27
MSKMPGVQRVAGSRLWRIVAITGSIVLVVCLAVVLVWFFANPLHLPDEVLQVLDQRASVIGIFTGMALGAAALVVSVAALRAQLRAEHAPARAAPSTPPAVSASGDGAGALGGDNFGIVSTGDGARNVQMRAKTSGPGPVYQAAGEQSINEGDDRRSYGGDHIEFHHNTFPGTVVGKQVNGPKPASPDGSDDAR